jgi:hypothetical protein
MVKPDTIARDFLDGTEDKLTFRDRFVAEKTDFGVVIRRPTEGQWNKADTAINDVTRSIITLLVGRGYHREDMPIRGERCDLWAKEARS